MIKVAIIGLGKMGMSHCSILGAHPDVDMAAMCDTDGLLQSAFKKLTKIACYTDYKVMINEVKPDAVYVVTPTKLHYDMVMYALEHNCHVFCEKPFSLTVEQGEQMVALAKQKNLVGQVGYVNRFIGTFNEMKRLLAAGVIGKPFHFMGENYGPVVLKSKGGTWRSEKSTGGGCLFDYAAHILDLINFVTGDVIDDCQGTFMPSIFSSEVEDAVYSTLIMKSGLRGQLAVNWSDPTHRKATTSLKIEGDRGKLEADTTTLKIYVNEANPAEKLDKGWNVKYLTELTPQVFFNLRGEEFSLENDHFIQCIKSGGTLENKCSFDAALQTDHIIHKLINNSNN